MPRIVECKDCGQKFEGATEKEIKAALKTHHEQTGHRGFETVEHTREK